MYRNWSRKKIFSQNEFRYYRCRKVQYLRLSDYSKRNIFCQWILISLRTVNISKNTLQDLLNDIPLIVLQNFVNDSGIAQGTKIISNSTARFATMDQ